MNNPNLSHFRCTLCQTDYPVDSLMYTCPRCGQAGTLDMIYNFPTMRSAFPTPPLRTDDWTMWRYRTLLPLSESDAVPPLPVGWTPLVKAPRLAIQAGVRDLWIKDDGRNPTGSLKDRASAMVVAHAMRLNVAVVTTASTGNAAAALAGIAASIGMRAVIFVPSSAPEAKIAQLRVYGAEVNLVQGTYDEAFDLCLVTAEKNGWYCRNTGINPYTTEGKKTVSYEIAEQLGWESPDVVVVSVGDGSIIGGVYKGFSDLVALGWITKLPRLIGVQAEGSAACYQAWQAGSNGATMQPIRAQTVADSISSDLPRDRVKAIRAVRNSSGAFVTVSDSEILDSIPTLARGSGIFTEPACAATWAGLIRARETGLVAESERVVLLGTGNGLKDIKSAIRSVRDG